MQIDLNGQLEIYLPKGKENRASFWAVIYQPVQSTAPPQLFPSVVIQFVLWSGARSNSQVQLQIQAAEWC